MIIKKLTIENFGKIKDYEMTFNSEITVISDPNFDDIVKAIGVVTNNSSLIGRITKKMVLDDTCISAEIELQNQLYIVKARGQPIYGKYDYNVFRGKNGELIDSGKFFDSIRQNEEEASLVYYRFNQKHPYSARFLYYKDPEKYYLTGEFQRRTDKTGSTNCFRSCLREHFNRNEIISCHESDTGKYNRMDDCLCYFDLNEFWDGFENIRNMHHEKWPMIVDMTDMENEQIRDLSKKAQFLGRQLIGKGQDYNGLFFRKSN